VIQLVVIKQHLVAIPLLIREKNVMMVIIIQEMDVVLAAKKSLDTVVMGILIQVKSVMTGIPLVVTGVIFVEMKLLYVEMV